MVRIEAARETDLAAIEAYLQPRTETCMFLRSNLRAAGLRWDGSHLQGQYVVAWDGDAVVGVVGHTWNGMLLIQADTALDELAAAAVERSGRRVTGFSGPLDQVRAARAVLGLTETAAMLDADETLMALSLDRIVIPPALARGELRVRRATGDAQERDTLVAWRAAYMVETDTASSTAAAEARAAKWFDNGLGKNAPWIAEHAGVPVAMSQFNARVPDCVQVGGVYTPPALRCRGFARAVVAGSLLAEREAGATRAILFTPSPDALAAYRAIGFAVIGQFGIVLFADT